ncbi:MAG: hypothetical protein D3917_13670 [Candidatus Electrothrix sp. AX5]|nr:hypothetical protein [Candidatus Electrothrix sp. AX5]
MLALENNYIWLFLWGLAFMLFVESSSAGDKQYLQQIDRVMPIANKKLTGKSARQKAVQFSGNGVTILNNKFFGDETDIRGGDQTDLMKLQQLTITEDKARLSIGGSVRQVINTRSLTVDCPKQGCGEDSLVIQSVNTKEGVLTDQIIFAEKVHIKKDK